MGGEVSKLIGESGERIAKYIFEEIFGYENNLNGTEIKCLNGGEHNGKTHGIDGLIGNVSQLSNRVLDIGYISVKKTEKIGYNKSDLKKHISDISQGLECFNKSKVLSDFKRRYSNIRSSEVLGILVWISDKDNICTSIQDYMANVNVPTSLTNTIIILDNRRLSFFIETVLQDKKIYKKEKVKFVYHNSGLNPSIQSYYGEKLPFFYLYSNIIAVRIEDNDNVFLKIYYSEEFQENVFRGMMDLAIDYDKLDSLDKIIFSFRNYQKSKHERMIDEILIEYNSYIKTSKIEILGHIQTLKNL